MLNKIKINNKDGWKYFHAAHEQITEYHNGIIRLKHLLYKKIDSNEKIKIIKREIKEIHEKSFNAYDEILKRHKLL